MRRIPERAAATLCLLFALVPFGVQAQTPGTAGYVQNPGAGTPQLDGRAVLSVGTASYAEGKDFQLLVSSPSWAAGTLTRLSAAQLQTLLAPANARKPKSAASVVDGRFVLLPQLPQGASLADITDVLARMGAVALVVVDDDTTRAMLQGHSGKTEVQLQGSAARPPLAVLAVSLDVMTRLLDVRLDEAATLAVHVLPAAAPLPVANGAAASQ